MINDYHVQLPLTLASISAAAAAAIFDIVLNRWLAFIPVSAKRCQSVSQSVRQSVSVNQSVSQSVSISPSVSQLSHIQSVAYSFMNSFNQSVNQSVSQSLSQSVSQSISQSVSQSVSQSISQSVNQSASQSVCRSVSLTGCPFLRFRLLLSSAACLTLCTTLSLSLYHVYTSTYRDITWVLYVCLSVHMCVFVCSHVCVFVCSHVCQCLVCLKACS